MPFKNYDAWRLATPWDDEPDHLKDCPCSPDSEPIYSECGGIGECLCSEIDLAINGCEEIDPECTCPTKAELEAERAEARRDAEQDR